MTQLTEQQKKENHQRYQRDYYIRNKDKIKTRSLIYYVRNKAKIKDKRRDYYQRPEVLSRRKNHIKIHNQLPEIKKRRNKHIQTKIKTNPIFALNRRLRIQLGQRLDNYSKNGKTKTSSEYGIDYNKIGGFLKPTSEKLKNNHIDHVIPTSLFDLNHEFEIKLCFSPENLQWLSGPENCSKNDSVRQEDLLELRRRIKEESDKLDINVLKHLLQLGETIYAKEQNKASSLPLVAVK